MTRKRTRESLGRIIHEPCFYCDGTGQLQSKQTSPTRSCVRCAASG
jgi:ribonuclease G